MRWKKLGRIWDTDENRDWMVSHASLPISVPLDGGKHRIFFSVRDSNNSSYGSYIDYDFSRMTQVGGPPLDPVLEPGDQWMFDENGVTLSCFCSENQLFYYLGWMPTRLCDFNNEIGVAKFCREKCELSRYRRRPILGKCENEPYTFGYPWVIKANGMFRMWYDVLVNPDTFEFDLRSAVSSDGVNWTKTGISGPQRKMSEGAIVRPCVIFEEGVYKMWYSVKVDGLYSLGYGVSRDGSLWERMDDVVGIDKSISGWDAEQIAHPFIFDYGGERFMLYNGNGFGRTGIGLAVLEN